MTADDEIRVVDKPAEHRFEALVGDTVAGSAQYKTAPGRLIFIHTVVEPAFEGRGIGGRLASGALDQARTRGVAVVPQCPFIAEYIRRHPAYQDLVR